MEIHCNMLFFSLLVLIPPPILTDKILKKHSLLFWIPLTPFKAAVALQLESDKTTLSCLEVFQQHG